MEGDRRGWKSPCTSACPRRPTHRDDGHPPGTILNTKERARRENCQAAAVAFSDPDRAIDLLLESFHSLHIIMGYSITQYTNMRV